MNTRLKNRVKTRASNVFFSITEALKTPSSLTFLVLGIALQLGGYIAESSVSFIALIALVVIKTLRRSDGNLGDLVVAAAKDVTVDLDALIDRNETKLVRVLAIDDVQHLEGSILGERRRVPSGDALDVLGWAHLALSQVTANRTLELSRVVSAYGSNVGLDREVLSKNFSCIESSEERGLSFALITMQHIDVRRMIIMGEAEKILSFSSAVYKDGSSLPLAGVVRSGLSSFLSRAEAVGARVIAVAYVSTSASVLPDTIEGIASEMLEGHEVVLGGFLILNEPLRASNPNALSVLAHAGVGIVVSSLESEARLRYIAEQLSGYGKITFAGSEINARDHTIDRRGSELSIDDIREEIMRERRKVDVSSARSVFMATSLILVFVNTSIIQLLSHGEGMKGTQMIWLAMGILLISEIAFVSGRKMSHERYAYAGDYLKSKRSRKNLIASCGIVIAGTLSSFLATRLGVLSFIFASLLLLPLLWSVSRLRVPIWNSRVWSDIYIIVATLLTISLLISGFGFSYTARLLQVESIPLTSNMMIALTAAFVGLGLFEGVKYLVFKKIFVK